MRARENSPINLQLALDMGETPQLLDIARRTCDYVDWVEAGTPWILSEGMAAVRALRSAFPQKFIVADLKIIDGGYYEASLGFQAGADLVTVLGSASDATLELVIQAARECGGQVMVDLLQTPDPARRAQEASALGAHFIGVHTAYDDQKSGKNPIAGLALLSQVSCAPLVVAGGMNLDTLPQVIPYAPATVIVGSAITRAADPARIARQIKAWCIEGTRNTI